MDSGTILLKVTVGLFSPSVKAALMNLKCRKCIAPNLPSEERRFCSYCCCLDRVLPERKSGCGSPVVKVSDHGRLAMNSSPVPQKTRRVGGVRYTLNLSRAQTSFRWGGVIVKRGDASSDVVLGHLTMVQNYEVRCQKSSHS
ncbi:uncharacterized protein TNCV_3766191 [Trichonephila clavipes]|nr:uncharacterized protein TNCV_3766191 [Trichonephila clavipes]